MANPLREVESSATLESSDPQVLFWTKEISLAKKRDSDYWRRAARVVRLYEGEKHEDNSFNILYANTETLLPACYNQLPRPFVDRRFHDPDPLAKEGAKVLERTLSELEDSGNADYDPFTKLMEQAVLGALIPGRGITWFKYEAKFKADASSMDDEDGEEEDSGATRSSGDAAPAGQVKGDPVIDLPGEKVTYETICGDDIDYDEFLCGYARRWVNVPWVARTHKMTKEDVKVSFGKKWVEKLKYNTSDREGLDWKNKDQGESEATDAQRGTQPTALVYEIWNKEKKQVIFFSPSHNESVIKQIDDPLSISGFFPCPEPLRFLVKRSKLTPTPPYTLYEEQAKELNRATQRINRILHALKVRGFYDGTIQGLKELMNSDDNTLLPAKNVAALQDIHGLENAIWLMPLDMLVKVLHELWAGREQIKETIYEITGIADIMRGQGQASATATQERIKNQWGTLRLNRMQRYVQEYARSCLRIMADIASKHFSLDTFAEMTNLDYARPEEVTKAQKTMQIVQQIQMQMQMAPPQVAQVPPSPGPQAGAPPAGPPPLPPQVQEAAQQAQAVLSKPPWAPILALLRSDVQRFYRIDIETNSTIADNTAEDKQNITEAMTALGNMYSTFQPAVEAGMLPVPAVKAMTLSVMRRFQFGRECEEEVAQMPDQLPPQQPDPKAPSPEELELEKLKIAREKEKLQADQVREKQELADMQQAAGIKAQSDQLSMAAAQRKERADILAHELKMQQGEAKKQEIAEETVAKREEAITRAAQAKLARETAKQTADDNIRSTRAVNAEKERATTAAAEQDRKHKEDEASQKRDLDKRAADSKVENDRQAAEAKVKQEREAHVQKLKQDAETAEKATSNVEIKNMIETSVKAMIKEHLSKPIKLKVATRTADGKIDTVHATRE